MSDLIDRISDWDMELALEVKAEIEQLRAENERLGSVIDRALDEGYIDNEWLQEYLSNE